MGRTWPSRRARAGGRTGCSPTAQAFCGTYRKFVDAIAREHRVPVAEGASGDIQPFFRSEDTEAAVLCGVGFEPSGGRGRERSGFEMPEVLTALALLELKGFVSRDGVGSYVRRAVP